MKKRKEHLAQTPMRQPRRSTSPEGTDTTKHKQAAERLFESEEKYRSLFENMLDGYAYCRMLYENGVPWDFVYLDVNGAFERLTRLKGVIGKKVSEVIPGIRQSNPELLQIYGRVALTGKPERFETYLEALGIWFLVSVYSPRKDHFTAVFEDITARRRAEEELKEFTERLEARVQERTAELERRADQLRALAAELAQTEERERKRLAQVLHDHLQQLLVAAKYRRRFPPGQGHRRCPN